MALGECRNDFLYCNGLRPTIFQCQERDAIFKDGECVRLDPIRQQCGICRVGAKKKAEKCDEVV